MEVEAAFPSRGNATFNKSCIRLVETEFLSSANCFLIKAIFLLEETIIGIKGKLFSNKNLILASGQLISPLLETIFSLHFSETPDSFILSIGKVFFNKILYLLVETDIGANNGFHKQENKIMRFPLDKNIDSISQNMGFVKKIRFYYTEKLLSSSGISKKPAKNSF